MRFFLSFLHARFVFLLLSFCSVSDDLQIDFSAKLVQKNHLLAFCFIKVA